MPLLAKHVTCRILGAVLGIASALAAPLAAVRVPQDANFDLEGTVSKQTKGELTVDSGQGIFFRVSYDEQTAILNPDGTNGSEKDLGVGVKVHVLGDLRESGEVKAKRIQIETKETRGP